MNPQSINNSSPSVSNQVEISLNGEKFLLNVERAKELGLLNKKKIVCVGQRYLEKSTGNTYILACVHSQKVILINLVTGGYWGIEKPAQDIHNITEQESKLIFWHGDFELIP